MGLKAMQTMVPDVEWLTFGERIESPRRNGLTWHVVFIPGTLTKRDIVPSTVFASLRILTMKAKSNCIPNISSSRSCPNSNTWFFFDWVSLKACYILSRCFRPIHSSTFFKISSLDRLLFKNSQIFCIYVISTSVIFSWHLELALFVMAINYICLHLIIPLAFCIELPAGSLLGLPSIDYLLHILDC